MNFVTAVDIVTTLSKRPDKRDAVKGHINRAIAFMVASANFAADLVEPDSISIDSTLYAQSIPLNASPFVRFRKIKYIRPTGFRKYLTFRDPSMIFDANGCEMLNVWYRSGVNLVFKLSSLQESLEVGYYQYHPALVNEADTDWMLDEMWPAVHDITASYIFTDIGDDASAKKYLDWGMAQFRIFVRDLEDGDSRGG